MSEFDTILFLVVATGYILAITKKKYPPHLPSERLFLIITSLNFGKMPPRAFFLFLL